MLHVVFLAFTRGATIQWYLVWGLNKGVAMMACQNRQQTSFSLGFGKNMGKWRVVGGKWEFQPLALQGKLLKKLMLSPGVAAQMRKYF